MRRRKKSLKKWKRHREENNSFKYDGDRIAVPEEDRSYLLLSKQFRDSPEDPTIRDKFLRRTYERAQAINGLNHEDKIAEFYNNDIDAIKSLSSKSNKDVAYERNKDSQRMNVPK